MSTMRLLEMSDSQFPVGNFSFSNGLETASYEKIVVNADTLRQYVEAAAMQSAYSDGIASVHPAS
jgi:urease accessory protein